MATACRAGLIGIDGPREIADVRAVHAWLAARPDVADAKIGAWGISYGGGAALNSLAAGVPWAAVEVAETWSDLMSALVPQGLAKSGVIGGYVASLPPARVDPAVFALRDAAFAGRIDEVRAFAAQRSSLSGLTGSRTPVFLMQGRRDFVFGLDQATRLYDGLAGPKRLWIGNHGHAPSTFPASDSAEMLRQGMRWFDRFLRGSANGIDRDSRPVTISRSERQRGDRLRRGAERPRGGRSRFPAVERSTRADVYRGQPASWPRRSTPSARRSSVSRPPQPAGGRGSSRCSRRRRRRVRRSWSRAAVCPCGQALRSYAISLIDQSTRIPKGSRFTVTLASSSLAQNPGNLLYLDLPMPASARITRPLRHAHRARPACDGARAVRRTVTLLAGALLLAVAAAAAAGSTAEPGVTATSVRLGGTVPLSGEASAFGAIGPGAKAYFDTSTRGAACTGGRSSTSSTTTRTTRPRRFS